MPRAPRLTLKRTVEPATLFADLALVKVHLRVDIADDDALIGAYVAAATRACEEHTRRQFMPATWRLSLDEFPSGELNSRISPAIEANDILLPRPPFAAVTSLIYKDPAGVAQTLVSGTDYLQLSDDEPARLVLPLTATWPDTYRQPGAVSITYVAGYADAASVPAPLKQAVLFLVSHLYENREPVIVGTISSALPFAVDSLLSPFICQEIW